MCALLRKRNAAEVLDAPERQDGLLPAIVKTAQSCFREVLVYEERLIELLELIL